MSNKKKKKVLGKNLDQIIIENQAEIERVLKSDRNSHVNPIFKNLLNSF